MRQAMNLNDVRVFVRVVDHGGFAPAARFLGVPKSTLSKRVAALEDSLGARLIHRSSRRFVVTEIGQVFYRHAEAMLIEAEAAEDAVKGRLAEPSGTVRITASVPTAQFSLARVLPGFARQYPKIHLMVQASDRFVDIVQEGFDIAVRSHFGPLPDSDLVQKRVSNEPFVLIASPLYLAQRGTPMAPGDIERHDGLLPGLGASRWTLTNQTGETVVVEPLPRFTADESIVLLAAAEDGLGIAVLPGRFCREAIEAGRLVQVLPEWSAGSVTTTILVPHRRGQLPAVRAAVDYLAQHLAIDRTPP
jgi:DNA-binding transcriptional LysR family regulator